MFRVCLGQNSALGLNPSSPIDFTCTFIILKTLCLCHWPDSYCMAFLCWRCRPVTSRAENAHGSCLISLCTDSMSGAALRGLGQKQRPLCQSSKCSAAKRWGKRHQSEPFWYQSWHRLKFDAKKGPWRQFSTKCYQLRKHGSWLVRDAVTSWVCCVPLPICLPFFLSCTDLFTQGMFWRSSKGQVINLALSLSFSCRCLHVCRHFLYYSLLQKEVLWETVGED